MAAAGFFGKGIRQQNAFQWFARHDKTLNAIEVPERLLFGIARRTWRQRLEKTIAAGARMARRASRVAFSWVRKDWKDPDLECLEVEAR